MIAPEPPRLRSNDALLAAMQPLSLLVTTCIAMSATAATLLVLVRGTMGEPHWMPMFKAVLLSGAVMLTVHAASRQVLRGAWGTYAFALLATLAVLFSPALFLQSSLSEIVLYALLAALWAIGLHSFASGLRGLPIWHIVAALATGTVLGVAYFFIVNTKGYAGVFTPEQTMLGLQHRDTLYHASLAAMLGKYRVASTGLDGLVAVPYHALAHAWIGVVANWVDIAPVHAFYLVPQIVGVPLLFFSLSVAVLWCWRPEHGERSAVLAVTVPSTLLVIFEIWDWASYLVSESFLLSLILLLLTLPLLVEIIERPRVSWEIARHGTLGLALLAMLFAKVSVGFIFSIGLGYVLIRTYRLTLLNLLKYGIPIALIDIFAVLSTVQSSGASATRFDPLHFLRAYPDSAWPNIFAIVAMLVIAPVLWANADARKARIIEMLVVLTLAAGVPLLLLSMEAGAVYYFMNVGVWVAIVFASSFVFCPPLSTLGRPLMAVTGTLVVLIVALFSHPQLRNLEKAFATIFSRLQQKAQLAQSSFQSSVDLSRGLFSPYDDTRARIAAAASRSLGGKFKDTLLQAGLARSRDQVVFVPPENTAFWTMHTVCTAQPFFVPAILAVPMIHGLPPDPEKCPINAETGFGYGSYPATARSSPMSDTDLCERVRRARFAAVVILEAPQHARSLSCR